MKTRNTINCEERNQRNDTFRLEKHEKRRQSYRIVVKTYKVVIKAAKTQ